MAHISIPIPAHRFHPDLRTLLNRTRAGFRVWRRTRPFWAGLWTLLGGAFIAYVPATAFRFIMFAGTFLWLGIGVGLLIGILGVFLWVQPNLRALFGVMIVLLALASFFTSDFGGFFLGMLLAMIGGSMALAWRTTPASAAAEPVDAATPVIDW